MESPLLPDLIELADGAQLEVRPTDVSDAERICSLYETLSIGDRHRRFFSAFKPHLEWCQHWASVGSRGGFGVIAIVQPPIPSLVPALIVPKLKPVALPQQHCLSIQPCELAQFPR